MHLSVERRLRYRMVRSGVARELIHEYGNERHEAGEAYETKMWDFILSPMYTVYDERLEQKGTVLGFAEGLVNHACFEDRQTANGTVEAG